MFQKGENDQQFQMFLGRVLVYTVLKNNHLTDMWKQRDNPEIRFK